MFITSFIFSCEEDLANINKLNLTQEIANCVTSDCVTEYNGSIALSKNFQEAGVENIHHLENAFRDWYADNNIEQIGQTHGQPAWELIQGDVNIVDNVSQFYLPLIRVNSEYVEAIIVITAIEEHNVYRFKLIKREQVPNFPQKVTSYRIGGLSVDFDLKSAAELFLDFTATIFSENDTELANLLPFDIAEPYLRKDERCITRYYEISYWSGSTLLFSYIDTEVTCLYVPDDFGSTGTRERDENGIVRINVPDRCAEDGVGCDDENEGFEISIEDAPGDKPLDVFDDKCNGLARLWARSSSVGNPEVFGVLTQGGNFLVTQVIGSAGGQVNGLYVETNAVTNVETTYYFYPVSAGATSLPGDNVLNNGTYYFIPISATIHSHSPCMTDGTDGISNRAVEDDRIFAARFPGIRHYILGCGAIGQFSHTSASPFNIQHGNASSLCNSFN